MPTNICAYAVATGMAVSFSIMSFPALAQASPETIKMVEANRAQLVAQIVERHGAAMRAHGVPSEDFATALWQLPSDALLSASLVGTPEEVNAIVSQTFVASTKDGPGTGANSWIGYTAGHNVASGTGSAVAPEPSIWRAERTRSLRRVRATSRPAYPRWCSVDSTITHR